MKKTCMAIGLCAILVSVLCAIKLFCAEEKTAAPTASSTAPKDQIPITTIQIIEHTTIYLPHGKTGDEAGPKFTYKFPSMRRVEDADGLEIDNGAAQVVYNKKTKIYQKTTAPRERYYSRKIFQPEWLLKRFLDRFNKLGIDVPIKETTAKYQGVEYKTLEGITPVITQKGVKNGPYRFRIYIDKKTGLVKADVYDRYDPQKPTVKLSSMVEELAFNNDIPDDFFTFTPPADAKENKG